MSGFKQRFPTPAKTGPRVECCMPQHDRLDLARVLLARAIEDETLVRKVSRIRTWSRSGGRLAGRRLRRSGDFEIFAQRLADH